MKPATTVTPRQLVAKASIDELVAAYSIGHRHPFALVYVAGVVMFVCPNCGKVGINGGTAHVIDKWRWSCHACRHEGTRYALEKIVLDDVAMLEALYGSDA